MTNQDKELVTGLMVFMVGIGLLVWYMNRNTQKTYELIEKTKGQVNVPLFEEEFEKTM